MKRLTIQQAYDQVNTARMLRRPFVVHFQKSTGEQEQRVMTCVTYDPSDGQFVRGDRASVEIHQKEDKEHNLVTVFSLDVFHKLVEQGTKVVEAGHKSWRRIPLNRCTQIEVLGV